MPLEKYTIAPVARGRCGGSTKQPASCWSTCGA